jgi:hypothetical protein
MGWSLKPFLGLKTPQPISKSSPKGRMKDVFKSTMSVKGLTTS